ncbi:MAG: hypothetical protein LBJ11_09345, partial [Oscillospiraceae bacterium]|nr:hypothetical protein [Oscillospiraceae bacterium]
QIDAAVKKIPAGDERKQAAIAAIAPIVQRDTGKKSANYMKLGGAWPELVALVGEIEKLRMECTK